MNALLTLIPAALFLGLLGLVAFLWASRSGQFDDLDGAAHRVLFEDDEGPESDGDHLNPEPEPLDMSGKEKAP